MSEINDAVDSIKEMSEREERDLNHSDHLNSRIAILVALTATFMTICNIKDGNIVQNMARAEAQRVNYWSYYQAKSTKQNMTEEMLDVLDSRQAANREIIRKYREKITRYESEKKEIMAKAEEQENYYNDLNVYDDQFDLTEALLTMSMALYGITSLTKKKWLYYFSIFLSGTGIFIGFLAFLKIPVQLEFLSKILG